MIRNRMIVAVLLVFASAVPVHAEEQTARASAEAVAAVSMFSPWSEPAIMLDGVGTVRLGAGAVGLVRPWIWKRPDGSWTWEWYQLQVRYQPDTRVPLRVDLGIMPSPLGLATLEFRPDLNPTVSPPFYYFIPLPRFDKTFDGVQMMSSGYPLGAVVSTSGARWDARGGVTTGTPARARAEFKDAQPSAMPQVVLGAGVSPIAGARIGAGFAQGRYRSATTPAIPSARATVTNIEAEYTFGHTRLKGEWIWDRFETTVSPAHATAFFVQAMHTFTPRWFGATRITSVDTPMAFATAMTRRRATVGEAIAGYRLSPDVTLRGGYYTEHLYRATSWDHQLCVSIVWSGRWN